MLSGRTITCALAVLSVTLGVLLAVSPGHTTVLKAKNASAGATGGLTSYTTNQDLHDGNIVYDPNNGLYYMYGTEYSPHGDNYCTTIGDGGNGQPFQWTNNDNGNPNVHNQNTNWCGFGVEQAPSMNGPWANPSSGAQNVPLNLINGHTYDPYDQMNFQTACMGLSGTSPGAGSGCYDARMVLRHDGTFELWFNVPNDKAVRNVNAYYVYACSGPAGPCAQGESGTSTTNISGGYTGLNGKPFLYGACGNQGTTSTDLLQDPNGGTAYLYCGALVNGVGTINGEPLNNSTGTGDVPGTSGITFARTIPTGPGGIESPGLHYESVSGGTNNLLVLTYSDPNCPYCDGAATGYAYSFNGPGGPWYSPTGVAGGGYGPPLQGRRDISTSSCGGQANTIDFIPVGGTTYAYEEMDNWNGQDNEAAAMQHYEPVVLQTGDAQPGQILQAFYAWTCTP